MAGVTVGLLGPLHDSPQMGLLAPPPSGDMAELRRQQAAFSQTVHALGRENGWLAIPALAPIAAVLAAEGAAALGAGFVRSQMARAPLNLVGREPFIRGGDTYAARIGRIAHEALKARLKQKAAGWQYDARHPDGDTYLKPDVTTPRGRLMEYKPNTPSGRRAAEAAVEKYQTRLDKKTRAIFYDPKDFK